MIDYGHGVKLGPLRAGENEFYRSCRNHPDVRKWCRQTGLISASAQGRWFESQDKNPSIQMFRIVVGRDERVSGVCGLTSIDMINRRAEFSLWVAPEAQGLGTGKKSLKTLFDYGFKELGLHSIWGETFAHNHARHMFDKLGMKAEGVRRDFYFKDGRFIDAILYSIKEKEWTP